MKRVAAIASLLFQSSLCAILDNIVEWQGVTISDSDGVDIATLSGLTSWIESGYSHAKEYTLDMVFTVTSVAELQATQPIFFYISQPKKPVWNGETETYDTSYETIYVVFRYQSDLQIRIYDTGVISVPENTVPDFGTEGEDFTQEQEWVQQYRQTTFIEDNSAYSGWILKPKDTVDDDFNIFSFHI